MNYRCPLCRQDMKDDFGAYMEHVEGEIVDLIKQEHPDWAKDNGSCPRCYEYYKKQLKG